MAEAAQQDEVVFDTRETIEISPGRFSVWGQVFLFLLGGFGLWMATVARNEGNTPVAVIAAAFGALLVALPIYIMMKQRRQTGGNVILSPAGLTIPGTGGTPIPWVELSGVGGRMVHGIPMIGIGLTDKGRTYLDRSKAMNMITKATEGAVGPGDVTLSQQSLTMPLGMFYALLLTYASQHGGHPWANEQLAEVAEISSEA